MGEESFKEFEVLIPHRVELRSRSMPGGWAGDYPCDYLEPTTRKDFLCFRGSSDFVSFLAQLLEQAPSHLEAGGDFSEGKLEKLAVLLNALYPFVRQLAACAKTEREHGQHIRSAAATANQLEILKVQVASLREKAQKVCDGRKSLA